MRKSVLLSLALLFIVSSSVFTVSTPYDPESISDKVEKQAEGSANIVVKVVERNESQVEERSNIITGRVVEEREKPYKNIRILGWIVDFFKGWFY